MISAMISGVISAVISVAISAVDTVDHRVLLSRLESIIGIKGPALEWFHSYLSYRSFSVHIGPHQSKSAPLSSGVPQGSILGPILFAIYLLPLGSILRRYNISFHCLSDDLQIYVPLRPNSTSIESLQNCLREMKDWLALNSLCLNQQKTEIVVFGDLSLLEGVDSALGPLPSFMWDAVQWRHLLWSDQSRFSIWQSDGPACLGA
uniref:Reverse transcriptase domain-containing protein n=1 Tax=Amphiprion percula TaxID=161767 RepID=A0A3P8SE34_AMPPE